MYKFTLQNAIFLTESSYDEALVILVCLDYLLAMQECLQMFAEFCTKVGPCMDLCRLLNSAMRGEERFRAQVSWPTTDCLMAHHRLSCVRVTRAV